MPDVRKAELVEGVVYMPSPVKLAHGKPDALYTTWLTIYAAHTPGVTAAPNTTVRLDGDNEPQPDSFLFVPGRRAVVDADGYVAGAPELVVEVASSSASYDLHQKKAVYRRCGVLTYVVHLVRESELRWFGLERGEYVERAPGDGVFRSPDFPGLWLHAEAALTGDVARVIEVLHEGLATPEHAAFVGELRPSR